MRRLTGHFRLIHQRSLNVAISNVAGVMLITELTEPEAEGMYDGCNSTIFQIDWNGITVLDFTTGLEPTGHC